MKLGKRGIVQDYMFIIIFVFLFILVLGFVSVIWYHINGAVQTLPEEIVHNGTKAQIESLGNIFSFVDRLIPFLFVGLWGVVMFFSITVKPTHPIAFLISLISLIFFALVTVAFVDLGTAIFSNSVFSVVTDALSNSLFFVYKLHYISFIVGLISIVIFYNRSGQQNDSVGVL